MRLAMIWSTALSTNAVEIGSTQDVGAHLPIVDEVDGHESVAVR
jgi:hypothetical protein